MDNKGNSLGKAPFNDLEASVVLRSCDGVDFHVYREILKVASPVFATIFSLPPSEKADETGSKNGVPVVNVTEDEETLDYLLRLCYPLPSPPLLTSISITEKVTEAARKYDIEKVKLQIGSELISLGSSDPLRLYSFACKLGIEPAAKRAAELLRVKYKPEDKCPACRPTVFSTPGRTCGGHPPTDGDFYRIAHPLYDDPSTALSPGCLFRLVRFICTGAGSTFCTPNSIDSCAAVLAEPFGNNGYANTSLFIHHPPDIVLRSLDMIDFPAHKLILRMALADIIVDQCMKSCILSQDGLPVVELTEDSFTLRAILGIVYSSGQIPIDSFTSDQGTKLWRAAVKYKMQGIADRVKDGLLTCLHTNPLRAYFIATSCDWKMDAIKAAHKFVERCQYLKDSYVPEMDTIASVHAYRALLLYHHEISVSKYKKLREISPDLPRESANQEVWYDTTFIRPSNIPVGLVLRLLNDATRSSYAKFIGRYDLDPVAYGRHLEDAHATWDSIHQGEITKVTLKL